MKYTTLNSFAKHLQDAAPKHLCPVYLLIIKEEPLRKEAENLLFKIFFPSKAYDALKIFTADEKIESILSELFALSFFSQTRVICLRNAEKLSKQSFDKIEKYLQTPCPDTYLIISASSLSRATRFYKQGEKTGVIFEPPDEKPWEKEKTLVKKIHLLANQAKIKMPERAAQFLLQFTGTCSESVHSEMDKLITYAKDKQIITEEDILALCPCRPTNHLWQLADAILNRQSRLALKIIYDIQRQELPFFSWVRQLRNAFQTKLIVSEMVADGKQSQIKEHYPYMKGQILEKTLHIATSYGLKSLTSAILTIDEAESSAKNSSTNVELQGERLIMKLLLR